MTSGGTAGISSGGPSAGGRFAGAHPVVVLLRSDRERPSEASSSFTRVVESAALSPVQKPDGSPHQCCFIAMRETESVPFNRSRRSHLI